MINFTNITAALVLGVALGVIRLRGRQTAPYAPGLSTLPPASTQSLKPPRL